MRRPQCSVRATRNVARSRAPPRAVRPDASEARTCRPACGHAIVQPRRVARLLPLRRPGIDDGFGAMSRTRQLMAHLRDALGSAEPLPRPEPLPAIPAPPARVYTPRPEKRPFAAEAARHTTALVGIGHVGTRYATDVVLQFQAELAVAHAAVGALLPDEWAAQNGFVGLKSRVTDHREFLLRPDLGRRLGEESLQVVRSQCTRS